MSISKAELIGALSYALDLTEGQAEGHALRCCFIGMTMAEHLSFPQDQRGDLYYMLLLKDIGCSSNAARICQLFLADDLTFKRDFKTLNESLPQVLHFVFSHTGLKAGLAERFRALVHNFTAGNITHELIETRCQRGAEIARQMRFSEAVATGILDLDEHWNGSGLPLGRKGAEISPLAQIALLAQVADVFHTASGPAAARREIARRSGKWFDPALAAVFATVAADPAFWAALKAPDMESRIKRFAPSDATETVEEDFLDAVAAAFAEVVDAKSPFTSGHSKRVALFADLIAEELGLSDEHRRHLKRAGLLHDIGKLGVSNQILDKNGKPDDDEWAAIKSHPGLGERILSRITAFADLAVVAASHHERLDGRGYPRGLTAEALGLDTRIISVADVFDALTADRPYRPAMPIDKAFSIMDRDVGLAFDPDCYDALKRALARVEPVLKAAA
ncbi:HDIG domain-containing protein [Rhizobium sp. RU20A]|nr:HDIG domain-containing protein [Rhizobium sp. RU20A]